MLGHPDPSPSPRFSLIVFANDPLQGRTKTSLTERGFPHHVELIVAEGGLGRRLDEMYSWHSDRDIQAASGKSRRDQYNRDYITWCFADAENAKAFAAEFGGRYLTNRD